VRSTTGWPLPEDYGRGQITWCCIDGAERSTLLLCALWQQIVWWEAFGSLARGRTRLSSHWAGLLA
ncbi:hypothetical protein PO002_44780, partial [Cupriavidus necator]|uniref:hypothetical protein n=1 Tax=Cupriavidus necator TaxID=106590 RepID=UPI0039C02366